MRWASAVSEATDTERALAESGAALSAQLGDLRPDLVLAFVSPDHDVEAVARALGASWPRALRVGCSARSVIGAGRELEEMPGLALAAAALPGVSLRGFHLRTGEIPASGESRAWQERLRLPEATQPSFLLLADPFSCDAERLLAGLDASFPGAPQVGGLASAASAPGQNVLLLDDRLEREGAVGVALHGDVVVDTLVAQGCRPIGHPLFVTRSREQLLFELDGQPPGQVIQGLYQKLSERDRELSRTSLFLGIQMKEDETEYRPGDFLIRNLIGLDGRTGALVVGTRLHDGMVVQFHLRDGATSAQDLEQRLARYRSESAGGPAAAGALLFSCLGRGRHLYGEADHDSRAFERHLGSVPLAGFFCNGEIGPVEGRTFLHGYTSAFGIFRRRSVLIPPAAGA